MQGTEYANLCAGIGYLIDFSVFLSRIQYDKQLELRCLMALATTLNIYDDIFTEKQLGRRGIV